MGSSLSGNEALYAVSTILEKPAYHEQLARAVREFPATPPKWDAKSVTALVNKHSQKLKEDLYPARANASSAIEKAIGEIGDNTLLQHFISEIELHRRNSHSLEQSRRLYLLQEKARDRLSRIFVANDGYSHSLRILRANQLLRLLAAVPGERVLSLE